MHRTKPTIVILAGTLAVQLGLPVSADPVFTPVPAPVEHVYQGGWEYFVGGGLTAFDCSGDGLSELFAAGGTSPSILLRNVSSRDSVKFEEATQDELSLTNVTGAYALDIDGDGLLDLAILRNGENKLLRGFPDCAFTEFDETLGFASLPRWTTAFSATWEADSELPTLAFGNYVDRTDPNGPFGACDANMLYRPHKGGYGPVLAMEPGHCTLSLLFSDWGRHGRADLRVSNDRHYHLDKGQEQLWAMETEPRLYSQDDGWKEFHLFGMGIASRDISNDGFPEVFLTSMGDQRLHLLDADTGGPIYRDAEFDRGISAHAPYAGEDRRPSTGWHAEFGDVDNDGYDDLFIAKGNVDEMAEGAARDPNNLLLQQSDGTFREAGGTAGVGDVERSRGAVLTDFNGDGLLDLAVVNRRAPLRIYQNTSQGSGNWLSILPLQSGKNRFAVGAWIEVDTGTTSYHRVITVGGGHAGGQAGYQHFGLGTAKDARVRIIWPDGQASVWRDAEINTSSTITRGQTKE